MCSYSHYDARDPDAAGGGWYQRPTLEGLLGSLLPNEANVLSARDAALVARLGGLPAPGPRETFEHHLSVLSALISDLQSIADPEARYRHLLRVYDTASFEWPPVIGHTGASHGAADWIEPFRSGLALYGATEGW
jgi:hypothetical protein